MLQNYDLKVPRSHFATHLGPGSEHCRFCKQAKQKRRYHRRKRNKIRKRTKFGEELQFDFYLPGKKLEPAVGGVKAALHIKDQGCEYRGFIGTPNRTSESVDGAIRKFSGNQLKDIDQCRSDNGAELTPLKICLSCPC